MNENNESEVREYLRHTPKCGECRYWHQDGKAGDCRRHPPVVIYDYRDFTKDTVFPETFGTEWCGEFEHAPKQ